MSAEAHDAQMLGAYVLETLDPDERRGVDAHLAECEICRAEVVELEAVKDVLEDIPPEALLHGPPDADLVLQRALRQVREEVAGATRRRWVPAVAAAAVLLAGVLGAGVALGRGTAPEQVAQVPPTAAPTASPLPPGTRVGSTVDASTGVRMTARVAPAAGWVRLNAAVTGIPAGENCRLIVVGRGGEREIAGGWIVSEQGEQNGTNLDGSAAVPVDDVAAIEVQNTAGKTFVRLDL
ncbi:zf-HC2 domain-containing protein [Phytohabitans sp. ZYX-F-186]|uniref:Zf-HC2 domain-containing protein n=1 Tax=Phytohabitans maris TaxID=3071409 RepID=A0ABU0ZH61_9ACTN|nr:zf-HC2 domain-containing protein [Phytohabitans sp. ZYX-F-186]MDQ7906388.1 zf-HC2 domain-containing protein [Phytohabitans sp. ZYX-F-186]